MRLLYLKIADAQESDSTGRNSFHCRLPVLIVVCFMITACSGIKVSHDYDSSADFTQLRSYARLSETQPQTGNINIDNPLLDSRIRSAVERNLTSTGFLVNAVRPDFHLRYYYTIERKIESDDFGPSFGFGIGSYGHHGGIGFDSGYGINAYDQGELTIDFLDAASGKLLWRGRASSRIHEHPDPGKATEQVNRTVMKILEQFPPEK